MACILITISRHLIDNATVPSCHNVAERALKKFYCIRLHISARHFTENLTEECQHDSKSAKSRCTIK